MNDLLTVKQLQELLQVDRVTIYRMLSDGRLPGFKVGGQWRFSSQAIDDWLAERQPEPGSPAPPPPPADEHPLPLTCVQPVQDIFAYAAEVGALVTDLAGARLTEPSHNSPFCRLVLSTPQGEAQCQASWRALAADPNGSAGIRRCHAGLGYTGRPVQVGDEPVALAFCGQFLLAGDELNPTPVADRCRLDPAALEAAAADLPRLETEQLDKLNDLFDKVGEAFSHIAQERHDFMKRLSRIADIASV